MKAGVRFALLEQDKNHEQDQYLCEQDKKGQFRNTFRISNPC